MVKITSKNLGELEKLFKDRFLKSENIRVSNFEELTEGWETDIYSFTIAYEQSGQTKMKEYVIRFYFGEGQNHQAEKEFNTMRLVRKQHLGVPEVLMVQLENSIFGQAFIIMDKIMGPTMADLVKSISHKETRRELSTMANNFVQLHAIKPVAIFSQHKGLNGNYLSGLLEAMETTVKKYDIKEFLPILEILQNGVAKVDRVHITLIHNDFHPQNILVQNDSVKHFIIDWSFAAVGDFRLDLAWTMLLIGTMVGREYRADFLKAYEDASGMKVNHFRFFEILKLSQRMLTILTWLDDRVKIPVRKVTKDAIRGDYKIHVTNVYDRLIEITEVPLPTIENL